MAKIKKIFVCQKCGAQSGKWIGKCPSCLEWNTYLEEVENKSITNIDKKNIWSEKKSKKNIKPSRITEISNTKTQKILTLDNEFNRVLGGGIVPGVLVLIGGQPGIGKSTLLLQVILNMKETVLYVSGEESEEQIKMRADRIGVMNEECFIITETNTSKILTVAKNMMPSLMVIDSIQTLASPHLDSMPGSVSQIRETAGELQRFAKEFNIPIFIIGHINKDGAIAGPKLLEHIVDTVLQFEGDRNYTYRIIRTLKNRFGSTDELGIYEMMADGLREVSNPSELLLSQTDESMSGSAIAATIEGMRPMLIETQALVTTAVYGQPQRTATGLDMRRVSMLLAVLEKRGGFPFAQNDVFLNIAGGLKISDPAMDLAFVAALVSSLEDISISLEICFAGEVGLSGEVRAVSRIEQRIQEAERLGFKQIYISKYNLKGLDVSKFEIDVIPISKIEQLYKRLFEV